MPKACRWRKCRVTAAAASFQGRPLGTSITPKPVRLNVALKYGHE
jgi:hypothetical protein